jgi:hypothetical protein
MSVSAATGPVIIVVWAIFVPRVDVQEGSAATGTGATIKSDIAHRLLGHA